MKDYYDIYLINKFKFDKIDKDKFRGALERTFKKRGFTADIIKSLNIIKESETLNEKWQSYSRSKNYAKTIDFKETTKCLEEFITLVV